MSPYRNLEELTLEEMQETLDLLERMKTDRPGEDFAATVNELMELPIKFRRVMQELQIEADLILLDALKVQGFWVCGGRIHERRPSCGRR